MQCRFTASTTKYTATANHNNFHHHVSSASTFPSLLSNYRIAFYPSAKTTFHHVKSFPLHRRRFVGPGKVDSSNNGRNAADEAQEEQDDDDELPELLQLGNSAILPACFVGLFTGIAIVLFNYTVHEIRDLSWGEIPGRGATWLREQPIDTKWGRVVLVPALGGLIVSLLNMIRTWLEDSADGNAMSNFKSALKPILKTAAACVTLGTGNSLGPEGPSVEIGVSVAKGVGAFLDRGAQRKLSLRAAGSAAGIAAGFNAAVGGCFFAVESVLWPSPVESSLSLTNTTSMVILSAVIASVISEIGLGSEPAFAVPLYDFRSPSELPLYLLLGALCGLVSVGLTKCTSFMLALFDGVERGVGIPRAVFPILGGLTVGFIALAYPEILYWGFENVDTLLESRPFSFSLSADLLVQLVAVKIVTTSLCRASGLVGGYYAPSLFIGAATGMAYGKIVGHLVSISNPVLHLSVLEVASSQAYALVGMAATLAGVCQVPLTAVLLLFELTQDYRIVLPLLGAVGFSAWITSDKTRSFKESKKDGRGGVKEVNGSSICELESSLCVNSDSEDDFGDGILVSQAMRRRYVTTRMSSSLTDVVSLMLEEKQSCALIVDDNDWLLGQLTLVDIQDFIQFSMAKTTKPPQVPRVSELMSSSYGGRCVVSCTTTPNMSLLTALSLMNRQGVSQLPVILEDGGRLVGLLDRESIDVASRAFAIRDGLGWFMLEEEKLKN
ncbi:chloride channel protein CLC-e [Salvia miltiorrhiza]|uniref:chloride channel protein CLC-e n=1 Tax=Salvia miltiorrhiza TaxID=226208 RepID=UPI0025AC91CA|nr:chloride channel protein CLC-e [Salvia miltiorrhiza]